MVQHPRFSPGAVSTPRAPVAGGPDTSRRGGGGRSGGEARRRGLVALALLVAWGAGAAAVEAQSSTAATIDAFRPLLGPHPGPGRHP